MPRFSPLLLALLLAAHCAAGEPEPPCAPPVIIQNVPTRQVLLVPHEEATTLPKLTLREVEVGRAQAGFVLDFVEKKCTVTEIQLKECEVEQKVVSIEHKPVTVTDPVTGKCCTVYQSCPVEKTIKVKVSKPVPVPREVVIRVPVLKPGPELVVKKLVLDTTTEAAVKTTFSAIDTVTNIPIVVPVPPPPPPPPPCPHCRPH
jgi:hypothetical protein